MSIAPTRLTVPFPSSSQSCKRYGLMSCSRPSLFLNFMEVLLPSASTRTLVGSDSPPRLTAAPSASELARSIAGKISLPARIDEITTLDAVDGAGDIITYHTSINAILHNQQERARMEQLLEQQLHTFACGSPDVAKLLSAGYTVEWRYRITGSGEEFASAVDGKTCVR